MEIIVLEEKDWRCDKSNSCKENCLLLLYSSIVTFYCLSVYFISIICPVFSPCHICRLSLLLSLLLSAILYLIPFIFAYSLSSYFPFISSIVFLLSIIFYCLTLFIFIHRFLLHWPPAGSFSCYRLPQLPFLIFFCLPLSYFVFFSHPPSGIHFCCLLLSFLLSFVSSVICRLYLPSSIFFCPLLVYPSIVSYCLPLSFSSSPASFFLLSSSPIIIYHLLYSQAVLFFHLSVFWHFLCCLQLSPFNVSYTVVFLYHLL